MQKETGVPPADNYFSDGMNEKIRYAGVKSMIVLFGYPTDSWEFASGLLAVAWGAGVIRTDWIAYGATEGYTEIAPLWVWGLVMLLLGLSNIVVMFRAAWDKYRAGSSLVLSFMWITLSYNQFAFGMAGGIGEIYLVAALLSILCTVRLFHFRRRVLQALRTERADCHT